MYGLWHFIMMETTHSPGVSLQFTVVFPIDFAKSTTESNISGAVYNILTRKKKDNKNNLLQGGNYDNNDSTINSEVNEQKYNITRNNYFTQQHEDIERL